MFLAVVSSLAAKGMNHSARAVNTRNPHPPVQAPAWLPTAGATRLGNEAPGRALISVAGPPRTGTSGVHSMTVSFLTLQPLVALIAGILILAVPRLLNYIVAIYLIIVGITGLWPHLVR